MNTFRYITAVAVIVAMAACKNEDLDLGGYENDPDAVRINATVGNLVESRSNPITSAAFENGDKIKLFSEGRTGVYTYNTDGNSGSWTFESGDYLRWNNPTQPFFAWFPDSYSGGEKVLADQRGYNWSDANYIGKSDYMYFEGDLSKPANGAAITLEMQRQTARVVVNGSFTYKNELESLNGYTITLTVSDGTTTVQPCLYNGNYYALLNPVAAADATKAFVTITLEKEGEADKEYIVRGIPVLEKGYSYTYNITIGKDKAEVGTVEVAPWTDGGVIGDDENMTEEHLGYMVTETEGVKTYIVQDAFGLKAVNRIMTSDVNELSSNIILAANITLTGENNWTPIGNRDNPYTGVFNGNQKTITGLHINNGSSDYQGFVGHLKDGSVKDLTLADSKITGKSYVGGVVGYLSYSFSITNVTVKDCEINGSDAYVGGVIGYSSGDGMISGATLLDSKVTADVRAGGIVGETISALCKIEYCLVQSNAGKSVIIIANNNRVGGIASRSAGPILGCKVINGGELTIRTNGSDGGGIAGYTNNNVAACLVLGANVTAQENVGGIVGLHAGYELSGNYAYCCTTGETPEAFAGAANVVGMVREQYCDVSSCYYRAYNDSDELKLVTEIEYDYTSGELSSGTPVDWGTACANMNNEYLVEGYVWDGTYDAPTLTAI